MKNKRFLITIVIGMIAIAIVSIGIVYGWFLNLSQTDPINANTKGIVFSYDITDGTTKKTDIGTYNIENVAFFDIDDDGEGHYFASMACEIKIDITNVCEDNLSITISFNGDQDSESDTEPVLMALITDERLTDSSSYSTVNDCLDDLKQDSDPQSFDVSSLAPEGVSSVYLYIFGVQPIDTADNSFFDDTYKFVITIRAVKGESE